MGKIENTLKGQLMYGVLFEDKLHTDFEIRLPLMKDNIRAVERYGDKSTLAVSVAVMAEAIVSLGSIPKEKITLELLEDGLVEDDFDILNEAFKTLKKKRIAWAKNLNTIMPPESS